MSVRWNFSEPAFRQACMRGLVIGGHLVRNEMLRLILKTSKTGRVYRRRGVEHQASAAGEPPASDIGNLVQSIGPPTPDSGNKLSVSIAISAKHAAMLEYGTTKMAARPFARPALMNMKDQVVKAVAHELRAGNFGVTGNTK